MIDWSSNLFSCVWRIKATPGKKILASFRFSQIGNYESNLSTSFPASLTWPPALTAARTTSPSPLETLLRWKKTLQQLGNRKRKTGRHFHPVLRQVASRLHRVLGRAAGDRVPHQPGLRQTFLFWANFVFFSPNFQPEMSPPSVVKALKSLKMWLCLTNQVQVSGMIFAFRSCHHHIVVNKINLQLKNRVTLVVGLLWTTQLLPRYVHVFIISSDS